MSTEKELAYRYDLFIAPDWRERFDEIVNANVKLPTDGRILEVNCGTGAFAIDLAEQMHGNGDVIGVETSEELLEIARAKAQIKKCEDVTFESANMFDLRFADKDFDAVIGDASLLRPAQIESLLKEMIRVAEFDAPVILKLITYGSFDEFFSIYWEALMNAGIVEAVWSELEKLIQEKPSVEAIEKLAKKHNLKQVVSITEKQVFEFENAKAFLESPIIKDIFLSRWLAILPENQRQEICENIIAIIDRDRYHNAFDVSIKATVIKGVK
ncbi:MAG: class I SAM-dependent methyltransferase [Acidobacteriota bacterium]